MNINLGTPFLLFEVLYLGKEGRWLHATHHNIL